MSENAAKDPEKLDAALRASTATLAKLEGDRQAAITVVGAAVIHLERVAANRAAWKKLGETHRTEIRSFLKSLGRG